MKYCRDCGTQLADEAAFCYNCGRQMTPQPVEEVPVAQEVEIETPVEEVPIQEETVEQVVVQQELVEEKEFAEDDELVEEIAEQIEPDEESNFNNDSAPWEEPVIVSVPEPVAAPVADPKKKAEKGSKSRDRRQTLSTAQYFFLIVLFCLPVIGLIFLFVWGCGNPKNDSLKRFSLAILIMRLIAWILVIAAVIVAIILFRDRFDAIMDAVYRFISALGTAFGY